MSDMVNWVTGLAIEHILQWTHGDVEVARQVAERLSSFDWQQVILDQQQKEINHQMRLMKNFIEWIEAGGRFCDDCEEANYEGGYRRGPMCTKVYSWPHPTSPYAYLPIDVSEKRYCRKCLRKLQNDASLSWTKRMHECCVCERLIPRYVGYWFGDDVYCLHCVEHAIEKQFIRCQNCDKKTASFTNDFCHDCYPIYRAFGAQVSNHLARAREANTPATLTIKQWISVLTYFDEKCAYCRSRPFQVLEHFLPISLGGGTTAENCVPACQFCNSRKGSTHPDNLNRIFPMHSIKYIKDYLEGEKLERRLRIVSSRELVVV